MALSLSCMRSAQDLLAAFNDKHTYFLAAYPPNLSGSLLPRVRHLQRSSAVCSARPLMSGGHAIYKYQ